MTEDVKVGPPETRAEIIAVAEAFASAVAIEESASYAAFLIRKRGVGSRSLQLYMSATEIDFITVAASAMQTALSSIGGRRCRCLTCRARSEALVEALDILGDVVGFGGAVQRAVPH